MRPTRRGWALILVLIALLLGWCTGDWTYYPHDPAATACETITVEDGYSFCDG